MNKQRKLNIKNKIKGKILTITSCVVNIFRTPRKKIF